MSSKKKDSKKSLNAADLVARARATANMTEEEALDLAVKETKASRAERATRR